MPSVRQLAVPPAPLAAQLSMFSQTPRNHAGRWASDVDEAGPMSRWFASQRGMCRVRRHWRSLRFLVPESVAPCMCRHWRPLSFLILQVVPLVAGQRLPDRVLFGISRVVQSSVGALLNPTASDNPTNNIVLDHAQVVARRENYATVCLLIFRPWRTASGLRHGHTTYAGPRSTIAPP